MNLKTLLFSFLLSLGLSGCSIVDYRSDVSYGDTGEVIPQSVINSIKPGKTSRQWLIDNMGKPTKVSRSDDGEELYTYAFEETAEKRFRVILLFQSRTSSVERKHIYVSLKDDLVTRCWKDFSYAEESHEEAFGDEAP